MPLDESEIRGNIADLEGKLATTESEATASRAREADALGKKEAALKGPMESARADTEALGKATSQPLPKSEAAELNYTPQHLSAEEMNKFSWGLLAMAMVGGAAAKGNWLGVSTSLKGAMQGILQGDYNRYQDGLQDFKTKFATAHSHDQDALERMRETIENKNLSLNAKLQGVRLLADEYDMPVMRAAAETKSLDGVANQLRSQILANERLLESHDKTIAGIEARGAQLTPIKLNDNAQRVYSAIVAQTGGKSDITKPLQGRYGRNAAPLFEKMVDEILAANPGATPEDVAADLVAGGVRFQGTIAAYRQGLNRQAAVDRLTLSVGGMEKKVIEAAKSLGLSESVALNSTLNGIRKQFGDRAYQKLKTEVLATSRQYIEAVTMPGSNAQMHASAQDAADSLVNPDMPLSAILGAFEGMNEEIGVTSGNLHDINEKLLGKLGQSGLITFPKDTPSPGGSDTPPAGVDAVAWAHMDPEDKELWAQK